MAVKKAASKRTRKNAKKQGVTVSKEKPRRKYTRRPPEEIAADKARPRRAGPGRPSPFEGKRLLKTVSGMTRSRHAASRKTETWNILQSGDTYEEALARGCLNTEIAGLARQGDIVWQDPKKPWKKAVATAKKEAKEAISSKLKTAKKPSIPAKKAPAKKAPAKKTSAKKTSAKKASAKKAPKKAPKKAAKEVATTEE
jgi:hypothetical protein